MAPMRRLTRDQRLRSPRDFRRVYARKCVASDARLVAYACENELPFARLGLSVSRRVGSAVCRNRWKRLLREAFRQSPQVLRSGIDLVLIPRAGMSEPPPLAELQAALEKLARQAGRRLRNKPPLGSRASR